ncbi:putative ABC transporter ATP-binding protein YbiT [bioreactor metagenome]|uniref:Putative ABC transporter ATP-binding protein YbiT n=1 Tax=bioreactor metagenome TaxID=1076179 RepID=A0A644WR04_9ZZZZ
MSLIKVTDLTFCYDGSFDNVFENLNLQIDTDWKIGFIGRNGRGKTTFLKLLMGEYTYCGTISASISFEYFPYPVENKDRNTLDILYEISGGAEEWRLLRETGKLLVPPDALARPFRTLSNGEQTKVLLAAMFLRDNSFLLIDEPTNHLDMEGRAALSRYLDAKRGFTLVSHDRDFLDHCVDHILSINRVNIEVQTGNFSSWQYNKTLQDNLELSQNESLKKEIRRLEFSARRTSDWSDKVEKTKIGTRNSGLRPDKGYIGHKSAKMMKRSKSIEARQASAIEEKSRLLKNIDEADELKLHPLKYRAQRLVLLDKISLYYSGKPVCENISFEIERGDRIALRGRNGSGKSSVLKLICGEGLDHSGELSIGSNLKISYISQDTSFLSGNLTEYAKRQGIDESLFKAILRKLDFERSQFEKDMSDYSGGQKKKVLIAKSLSQEAHLYLWDEPLNFVDVLSRMQIERLLLEYKPTILFVEHDKAFCDHVATKIIRLPIEN